jgi:hypothetical protein
MDKRTLHMTETDLERRERKKQRKERKRQEKLKRKQAILSANIVSEPDIEENGDECVIRIAPKPIKIKIKTILPPVPPGQEAPSSTAGAPGLPDTPEDRLATSGEADDEDESVHVQNMHPKKKLAHSTTGPLQNGGKDHHERILPKLGGFLGFPGFGQGYLSLKSPGHSIPSLKPHHYSFPSGSQFTPGGGHLPPGSSQYPGASISGSAKISSLALPNIYSTADEDKEMLELEPVANCKANKCS